MSAGGVSLSFLGRAGVIYAGALPIARVAPLRKEGGRVRWSAGSAVLDQFHCAIRQATHVDVWYRNFRITYAVKRGKVTDGCLQIQCPALEAVPVGWGALPSPQLVLGRVNPASPALTPPRRLPSPPATRSSSGRS